MMLLALLAYHIVKAKSMATMLFSTYILQAPPVRWIFGLPRAPSPGALDHEPVPHGAIAVIVGATHGIGRAIAERMYREGAHVVLAVRDVDLGEQLKTKMTASTGNTEKGSSTGGSAHVMHVDLADLDSVRAFVEKFAVHYGRDATISYLFLNAGIAKCAAGEPYFTPAGLERLYVTNFLSHFLLTYLFYQAGRFTQASRIISTGSAVGYFASLTRGFEPVSVPNKCEKGFHTGGSVSWLPHFIHERTTGLHYAQTKGMGMLFNRLFGEHLSREALRAGKTPVKSQPLVAGLHPGLVNTNIWYPEYSRAGVTHPLELFMGLASALVGLSPEQGAASGLYLALTKRDKLHRQAHGENGRFWHWTSVESTPADWLPSSITHKWWARWCRDAEIDWDL